MLHATELPGLLPDIAKCEQCQIAFRWDYGTGVFNSWLKALNGNTGDVIKWWEDHPEQYLGHGGTCPLIKLPKVAITHVPLQTDQWAMMKRLIDLFHPHEPPPPTR
ncbi:hypothetical protein ABZ883_05885 [Streptomyces sp. NPDC046977]|uniref:hypothetical protein n=1 Tax=Streptomyces sp. NPDC046977 TaxID=3154703 RepID=UPI00340A2E65